MFQQASQKKTEWLRSGHEGLILNPSSILIDLKIKYNQQISVSNFFEIGLKLFESTDGLIIFDFKNNYNQAVF